MSNEPENRIADPRVTETYRELASEHAPAHLDERVLKMAAGHRTPYGRARAWIRPAAWAATIALSFGIVLELTQLPSFDVETTPPPPTSAIGRSAERQAPADHAARPIRPSTPEPLPAATVEKARAPIAAEQKSVAAETPESSQMPARQELAARATAVMQEAEDLAQARTGSDNRADLVSAQPDNGDPESGIAEPMSTGLAGTRQEEADRQAARKMSQEARGAVALLADVDDMALSDPACLPSQRKAPDDWLACIRDLRERGLEVQADEEYEEFQRLFPEFDDSITDK
ncbi:MAG: hypothetical protein WBN07_06505 [Woeseiaceae bacterium]